MEQEKKIIFQRGLLDWMLPFWTFLSECEIRDKIHIIYKELTRDWVKPKVAKSEFYPLKSQNAGDCVENSLSVALSSRSVWVG